MARPRTVVVIADEANSETINVNGIFYRRIPTQRAKPLHGKLAMILMAYGFMFPSRYNKASRDMSDINIIDEFKLIDQKKSKLSRAYREHVIAIFNRNFEKL